MKRFALLFLLALCGCSSRPGRIDATSDETLKQSIDQVAAGLEPDQADRFRRAVAAISVYHTLEAARAGLEVKFDFLDGLTAEAAIDQAARLNNPDGQAEAATDR